MQKRTPLRLTLAWGALAVIGVATLLFGLITAIAPGTSDALFFRTIGVATIGLGLFGTLISIIPFRRRERWAWFALWFYPLFWLAHYLGKLPPGQDHIHQIVFLVLSLFGLLAPAREFFAASQAH